MKRLLLVSFIAGMFLIHPAAGLAQTPSSHPTIAPNLKGNISAFNVAWFIKSYQKKDFDNLWSLIDYYVNEQEKIRRTLPADAAQKKIMDMLAQDRKVFLEGTGPLYLGGLPLQQFLPPDAIFQVVDLKPGEVLFGGEPFMNAFVRIEYPDPTTAPKSPRSPNPLKLTYLVIPVRIRVIATPYQKTINGFAPLISVSQDANEYWELSTSASAKK